MCIRDSPLTGNTTVRIGREIRSRLKANVLVLESRSGQKPLDHAILVACDLCVIRPGIQEGFRKHLAGRLPGADLSKLFLAAWLEYVEATVARYKKVVNEWEIWNEPFGQGQDDAIKPVGMLEYESNSPRKLTVAAFEKARTSVALGWYTDQVPRDELAWDRITVTVKGVTFRNPVCVEMITGKVYELDKSAWTSAGGSPKSLSENRDWDPSLRCLSRFSDRQ